MSEIDRLSCHDGKGKQKWDIEKGGEASLKSQIKSSSFFYIILSYISGCWRDDGYGCHHFFLYSPHTDLTDILIETRFFSLSLVFAPFFSVYRRYGIDTW